MVQENVEVLDIFCGVGGLTYGLQRAGLAVVAGIDFDGTCKYAYEYNNHTKFIHADVRKLRPESIQDLFSAKGFKIIAGCAPCQHFSTHTQKYKHTNRHSKWDLLNIFKDIVLNIQPDIVTMENVPKLSKELVFAQFKTALETHGYRVWWDFINCAEYGVPQSRTRLVLLASKMGEISMLPPTHKINGYRTVNDTISDLPSIDAGEMHDTDFLHKAAGLSELNLRRIRQSVPGGSWRNWDEEIKLSCHKKASGRTYPSVYGRMRWNELAPTITTQFYNFGTGRFGHPEQDRALSLREGALLQTFPRKYKFCDPKKPLPLSVLARHIGNAVPVRLGYIIGKSIISHLNINKYIA
jgi:DNA (cytosine-5)-methyltransferase 1